MYLTSVACVLYMDSFPGSLSLPAFHSCRVDTMMSYFPSERKNPLLPCSSSWTILGDRVLAEQSVILTLILYLKVVWYSNFIDEVNGSVAGQKNTAICITIINYVKSKSKVFSWMRRCKYFKLCIEVDNYEIKGNQIFVSYNYVEYEN